MTGSTNDNTTNDVKAIGYVRVSTFDQEENGASLEAQTNYISAAMQMRGWDLVNVVAETASGKSVDDRALLMQVVAEVEAMHGALVVAKLDRLSRSVVDIDNLLRRAEGNDFQLIALDVGADTSTASGRLVWGLLAQVAQWEREVNGERTSAGMAQKRAEGVHVGRPRTIDRVTVSDEEKERCRVVIERVLAMREDKIPYAVIAETLNEEGLRGLQGGRLHATSCHRIQKMYGQEAA